MLGHAQANPVFNRRILIGTNDDAIAGAIPTLPEAAGLTVDIANSIAACSKHIEDFIDALVKLVETRRETDCRAAVLQERQKVEEFVRQKGVFSNATFRGSLAFGEIVEGVDAVTLSDIQVEAIGWLPTGTKEARLQVSLEAKLDCQVRVSSIPLPAIRQFKVGGETIEDPLGAAIRIRLTTGATTTRVVPVTVRLEGSIHSRRIEPGQEQFSDLILDSFNPAQPWGIISSLLAGTPPT
jgi:hypothetical protein